MLSEELHSYCEADVDVLRLACLNFRSLFQEVTGGLDPFQIGVTIASCCMFTFRHNFLKEEQIAVVPFGGYRRRDRQSVIATKWLKWLSHSRGIGIRIANSAEGEMKIAGYKVDGWTQDENGDCKAFEFNGYVVLCSSLRYIQYLNKTVIAAACGMGVPFACPPIGSIIGCRIRA